MRGIRFRLQSGKVRILEEALESWQIDHAEAMLARDVEELVHEALTLPVGIASVWEQTWDDLTQDRILDVELAGTLLRGLFDRQSSLLTSVREQAQRFAERTGHRIDGLDRLSSASEEVRSLRERVLNAWPWEDKPWPALDRGMVEESRSSSARGEGESGESILARLHAGGPLIKD